MSTPKPTGAPQAHPFDQDYFQRGPYAQVSFRKYSQYWWSNRFYARLVSRHVPSGGRVLEIGCGMGHLLTWLEKDHQVFGSDINAWALEQARKNVPQGDFALLSAEDLSAYPAAFFQVVVAKHVVEHLPHPEQAIAEMSRVLAPGGLLLLATPNLDSPMRLRKKEQWIGYQDPTHISLKPPAEWLALLRQHLLAPDKVFSDGFWDAPYVRGLPVKLQKLIFGLPGGLQAVFGWSIIPLRWGESLIVLARRR
jgi:SAM-dependent methyltransferase